MPIFKEIILNNNARVAIWKVEESETFFTEQTGFISEKKNETKRIEHLAGRFLLQYLVPNLDFNNIAISPLGKPFMTNNSFHFSITHSFPYIGVAIDYEKEVGMDVQIFQEKIHHIQHKFLSEDEQLLCNHETPKITLAWTAKEAAFKRYGLGAVDFIKHMPITEMNFSNDEISVNMNFQKEQKNSPIMLKGAIEKDFAWSVTV